MFNSCKFCICRAHSSFQNVFLLISFLTALRVSGGIIHVFPVEKLRSGGCDPGQFVSGRQGQGSRNSKSLTSILAMGR